MRQPSSVGLRAALGAPMLLAGCSDPCENTVVREIPSPDGRRRAVVFERSCGATTAFTTQISVLSPGASPRDAGDVFTADTDHGRAPPARWGGPDVRVRWLDARTLEVRHHPRARVFGKETRREDLRVRYVRDSTGWP